MVDRTPPNRMSPQQPQEDRSRCQFAEAMAGWVCNSIEKDFGEDFLVDIWREDKGVSTGCSFKCQLKSTTDWRSFLGTKHPGELHYRLKTKDLKHWHEAHIPVVVVLWDVEARLGYWQDVPAMISSLTAATETWWNQDDVTVSIPVENLVRIGERTALRDRVVDLCLPARIQGRTHPFSFEFLNTPEGVAASERYKKSIEEGIPTTISRTELASVKMPDWFSKIFGEDSLTSLTIGEPIREPKNHPIFLEAIGESGFQSISLSIRQVEGGTKCKHLNNAHEIDGIVLSVLADTRISKINFELKFDFPPKTLSRTLQLASAFAIVRQGGQFRFTMPGFGVISPPFSHPACEQLDGQGWLTWRRYLLKLVELEDRLKTYGRFCVPERLSLEIVERIDELYAIVTKAELVEVSTFRAEVTGPAPEGPALELFLADAGSIELLGVAVPIGPVKSFFEDPQPLLHELTRTDLGYPRKIEVPGLKTVAHYLDWESAIGHPRTSISPEQEEEVRLARGTPT